jgi:RNA polymerase sigma factor (TIGR02999 family)
MARGQMGAEGPGATLQPTALVHEAWLKLVGPDGEHLPWNGRAHFFGAAARAMRQILVDHARHVGRIRRGGDLRRQPSDAIDAAVDAAADPADLDFEALDAALTRLEAHDPRAAKVVELRFFAGLSVADTARALEISERTVAREWNVARAWLARRMTTFD